MPRIYILLMSVLISAFYACDHRGKPYPATLSQIESLADTNPEEAGLCWIDCGIAFRSLMRNSICIMTCST